MKVDGDTGEAVQAMGTNALPFLVKWLDYGRSERYYKVMAAGRKYCPRLWNKFYAMDRRVERMNNAIWAFDNLRSQASPAIPGLVRLMKVGSTNTAGTAAYVLGGIGEDAVPALLDVLTNRQVYLRIQAGRIGTMVRHPLTNGAVLVPVLVAYLTNQNAELRTSSANMLGRLEANPDLAVPALISVLHDTDKNVRYCAIVSLGSFRKDARSAVPYLLPVLKDADQSMCQAAEDALQKIAPEVLEKEGK
jgi:HEAT repeat protein